VDSKNNISVFYVGTMLAVGYFWPESICGDFVNIRMFTKQHSELLGSVMCAFRLSDQNGQLLDLYLDCFYLRSFVRSIKRTMNKKLGNVTLMYDTGSASLRLKTLQEINPNSQLYIYMKNNVFDHSKYVLDVDANEINNIKND
jgi:hypothetical protein